MRGWELGRTVVLVSGIGLFCRASDSPEVFSAVNQSLVLVKTPGVVGSGFIMEMDKKKYLVTNEHVLRGGAPFTATLLDGRCLSFESLEVAEDRDLVRLALAQPEVNTLVLSTKPRTIPESIFVFGNSDGSGVATTISGKLIGIGPILIEVDAPFVHGNSGSPIVDQKGEVVGVATFAVRDADPNDWVKNKTRFVEVRRFGVRVNDVKWKKIEQKEYFVRADALKDIETFCCDVYQILFTNKYSSKAYNSYFYENEKGRYVRFYDLCLSLQSYYSQLDTFRAYSKLDDFMHKAQANAVSEKLDKVQKTAYKRVAGLVQGNNWLTPQMKNDADYWLEVLKLMWLETD